MAFIDELKFNIKAGRGGNGVVRWRREKFIPKGGPNGGDGGRGGNVYIHAIRDVHVLSKYRHQKEFKAEDGYEGEGGSRHGRDGEDLYIDLPVGSIVTNEESGTAIHLTKEGQKELILKGGGGGFGNEHFKSSTNVTPKEATKGRAGEQGNFAVELELFADVGFIGLPNAGKSSLLNTITNAQAKIGSYAFTTLDPNLGEFHGFILADIPGLIEGASEGKGLGTKFLRHIKRTKMLVHLVSFENEESKTLKKPASKSGMMKVYKEIRKELKTYGEGLDKKEEIIVLTKTDTTDEKTIAKKIKEFEKLEEPVFTVSLYDDASVKKFSDSLVKLLRKK
jgi:GTP-binding protein